LDFFPFFFADFGLGEPPFAFLEVCFCFGEDLPPSFFLFFFGDLADRFGWPLWLKVEGWPSIIYCYSSL